MTQYNGQAGQRHQDTWKFSSRKHSVGKQRVRAVRRRLGVSWGSLACGGMVEGRKIGIRNEGPSEEVVKPEALSASAVG